MENEKQTTTRDNPLIKKISMVPPEYFTLPSQGVFYNSGELDAECENAQVSVYPMTSIDELELKSADMLYTGEAIVNVLRRRVPQILKPMELLAGDVDFLLTCLRKVSYGNNIIVKHKCTTCGDEAKEAEYTIPASYFIENSKKFDKDKYKNTSFKVDGFKIATSPLTLGGLIKIFQIENSIIAKGDNITAETLSEARAEILSLVIKKVDTIDDKEMIKEWAAALSPKTLNIINNKIGFLNEWGVRFEYEVQCEECDAKEKIQVVTNPIQLFTLPSGPEIQEESEDC